MQDDLLRPAAQFDGATYDHARDHDRLQAQLTRVWYCLCDHKWHTLAEVSRVTGDPPASVSARIRDLRKRKYGGYSIARQYVTAGVWEYCLLRTIEKIGAAR